MYKLYPYNNIAINKEIYVSSCNSLSNRIRFCSNSSSESSPSSAEEAPPVGDFSLCLLDGGLDGGGDGDDTRSKSLDGVFSSLCDFCFLFPFFD